MQGLMSHCGTGKMTREMIEQVATPPAQGARHLPVPHIDVINGITRALDKRDYEIINEDFAVGQENTITLDNGERTKWPNCSLFGVMEIARRDDPLDGQTGLAIGFRSNNSQKFPVQFVAGQKVFVCDNLIIDGEYQICKKKHTLNLNLFDEIDGALDLLPQMQCELEMHINALRDTSVSDLEAQASFWRMFENKVVKHSLLRKASALYFNPKDQHTDVTPRSLWGVHNAVTRVLRTEPIHRRLDVTQGLTRALLVEAA